MATIISEVDGFEFLKIYQALYDFGSRLLDNKFPHRAFHPVIIAFKWAFE